MTHVPGAHEVETYSGRFVDVGNPSAADITLEDIAHALSNVCRYGGHCRTFYSVAEHAVFVSRRLERKGCSRDRQVIGLHHDDAEAFLGDIPRPMKPLLGAKYTQMTDRMDKAIIASLGLPTAVTMHDPDVKDADNFALFVEARHLLPSEGRQWWNGDQGAATWNLGNLPSRIVIPDYWLGGLPPAAAERLFIERHKELVN